MFLQNINSESKIDQEIEWLREHRDNELREIEQFKEHIHFHFFSKKFLSQNVGFRGFGQGEEQDIFLSTLEYSKIRRPPLN